MAKETKDKKEVAQEAKDDFKASNLVNEPSLVEAAFADLQKEKDEKKKHEIRNAIGMATYNNSVARAELRARRREDDITKEKLDASKVLLERLIGVETEIKDGCLVPTKNKCKESVLTPTEYKEAKKKLEMDIDKKVAASNDELRRDLNEIRNSYEGRYQYWW